MDLEALSEQIGRGLIAGSLGQWEHTAGRTCHRFVPVHQFAQHVECCRFLLGFLDGCQASKGGSTMGCNHPKRSDALGDHIEGVPEFGVLLHEHQVQGVEHGTGHVPVEPVGLSVQHISVRKQTA